MELQASTLIKERHKRGCGGWGLAELLWLGSPALQGLAQLWNILGQGPSQLHLPQMWLWRRIQRRREP